MSYNDLVIEDQTFPATLADLNSALQSLASLSSAATAPAITYPYQLWADTANDLLKVRNGANNAWLTLAKFDTTNNRWEPRADILQALTTAGVTIRNAAGTTIATFSNAGTMSGVSITVGVGKVLDISLGTLTLADNQIDGVKVKAATTTTRGTVEQATNAETLAGAPAGVFADVVDARAAAAALAAWYSGEGQTWQNFTASRAGSVNYQNTTGRAITVSYRGVNTGAQFEASSDGVTWVLVSGHGGSTLTTCQVKIPNNHYYRVTGTPSIHYWVELR